jgi:hypothetical protein
MVVMIGKFVPGPCRKLTFLVASAGAAATLCADSAMRMVPHVAICASFMVFLQLERRLALLI